MRSSVILVWAVLALLLVYGVPTLIEYWASSYVGPFFAYVVFGDLTGCALLALWKPKVAIGTYALVSAAEYIAWRSGAPDRVLLIGADLVPALICSAVLGTAMSRVDLSGHDLSARL